MVESDEILCGMGEVWPEVVGVVFLDMDLRTMSRIRVDGVGGVKP